MEKSKLKEIADAIYGGAGNRYWHILLRMSKLQLLDLIDVYYLDYCKPVNKDYLTAVLKIRRNLRNAIDQQHFNNKMASSEF